MNTEHQFHQNSGVTMGKAAIIAGIGLFLMAVLAPIANFSILQKLIVPDDPATTFSNIAASEGLFRTGICLFLIVAILDIIVAWALFIFLKPVNRDLSLLAAWFRMVYATLLIVVLIDLLQALQLLPGADSLATLSPDQVQVQFLLTVNAFSLGWEFGLIVFGLHLLLLGYLVTRAGYMRKILGILLILASLGYLIDGLGKLLSSQYHASISLYTFIGEVVLIFWLLLKGRKIREPLPGNS